VHKKSNSAAEQLAQNAPVAVLKIDIGPFYVLINKPISATQEVTQP